MHVRLRHDLCDHLALHLARRRFRYLIQEPDLPPRQVQHSAAYVDQSTDLPGHFVRRDVLPHPPL